MSEGKKLVLHLVGNIAAFKNTKMMARNRRNGKIRPITDPKLQMKMDEITNAFTSQLSSVIRTIGGETLTAQQLRSSIASLVPLDDSWQWVPKLTIEAEACSKGNEGATVEIETI
jgi:hypothetical protein